MVSRTVRTLIGVCLVGHRYRAPIDEGSDKTVVVKDQLVTSDGLAVDWIYNHIYFTDIKKSTIELTNFDGNMGKVLIQDDLEIPRAIALDPIDGYVSSAAVNT